MGTKNAQGQVTDPVAGRFYEVWSVDNVTLPRGEVNFTTISGLEDTTEVITYVEGNDPRPRKIPGTTNGAEITLTRGVDENARLINWRRMVAEGGTTTVPSAEMKKDLYITLYDRSGTPDLTQAPKPIRIWFISKAWPSSLSTGELNAGASEILTQSVTLQSDGGVSVLYP